MSDIIEGFLVGGTTQIIVANVGHAVDLTMRTREASTSATLSVDQSKRLRRLLAAAEKRAEQGRGRA